VKDKARKVMKNTILAYALLVAFGVHAQSVDLLAMLTKARSQDASFIAAKHVLEAAAEKLPQAKAALLPTLNLNSNINNQNGDASFGGASDVRRHSSNWSWTLQINQPLYKRTNNIALEQADIQLQLAEQQFRLAEQELALRVAQSYLEALQLQQNVGVITSQVGALEQQLVLATRNFTAGLTTVTDTYEAQSRLDVVHAQLISARTEVDNKYVELERILGERPTSLKMLNVNAALPPLPSHKQLEWMASAREISLPVQIAQLQLNIAEKEIRRTSAGHLPTLDLTASHGANSSSGSVTSPANISTRTLSSQIGLQLSIPLYAGGGISSRERESIAARNKALVELEIARRSAQSQAQQALNSFVSGQAQLVYLSAALGSTKSAVDATKIGYKIGTRINVDVLNAEQQLFNAQRDVFKARVENLIQGLKFKAAAGVLLADDLTSINAMLQNP
jgi:outer membrane protein